jgi:phosphoglycerol transferase MdoB-like AlkP superfamily enzyme
MTKLSILDWSLFVGVIVYGAILAVYFEKKHKLPWQDFFLASFFVAALAAVLIGAYQVIRPSLSLP